MSNVTVKPGWFTSLRAWAARRWLACFSAFQRKTPPQTWEITVAARENATWGYRWIRSARGVSHRQRVLLRTFLGRVLTRYPPAAGTASTHLVVVRFPLINGASSRSTRICTVRVSARDYEFMLPQVDWPFEFFSVDEGQTWRPVQEET